MIRFVANPKLHEAIGASVENYARVESAQASILQEVLKLDLAVASILFHSPQSTRSRTEMMQGLLNQRYQGKFKAYWAKCEKSSHHTFKIPKRNRTLASPLKFLCQ